MNTEAIQELEPTASMLLQTLSLFSDTDFNKQPHGDGWTAAQVAEHLRLANGGILELLHGKMKKMERAPDALVERLKADFCNFDIKMKSPQFVVPQPGVYQKAPLLNTLKDIMNQLGNSAHTLDLSLTNADFLFPVYGALTRLELIAFAVYHTQRHTFQLKTLLRSLNESPAPGMLYPYRSHRV
jgi:uncharacterized damage-inducible protein DinB